MFALMKWCLKDPRLTKDKDHPWAYVASLKQIIQLNADSTV